MKNQEDTDITSFGKDRVWSDRLEGVSSPDGEPVSMLDRGLGGLTVDELKEWVEDIFGDLDIPENRHFYISCISQAYAYETAHCNQEDSNVSDFFDMCNIQSGGMLFDTLKVLPDSKLYQDVFLTASAIAHIKSTAKYTTKELESCEESFNDFMNEEVCHQYTEKKGFKRQNRKRIIETEVKPREIKALFRVLDKMWVKPSLQFPAIKDILGGRIFVNGNVDFNATSEHLKNFNKPFRFSDKKKTNENRGSGFGNVSYLESVSDGGVPIEVQIIDRELVGEGFELCEESYPFYSEVLQASLREDRRQNNEQFLKEGMVSAKIEEFVKRKDLNGNLTESEARERYWARWNASFFKHKGVFYSYQNVLRLRDGDFSPIYLDLLQTLFGKFNRALNVKLSSDEWLEILDDKDNDLLGDSKLETLEDYLLSIKGVPKAILARVTLKQADRVNKVLS